MKLKYQLSFSEPHTHYVEVEMHISDIKSDVLNLKMAVWTPGSYLIREYQKNIDYVSCTIDGQSKRISKTDKNTWTIDTEGKKNIVVYYKVYSYEYTVRTNFIDESHALLNGAPTFLYIDGFENLPCEIDIHPFHEWLNISTSLPYKDSNKWIRIAKNLDELIDSPFEIGNHTSHFFEVSGIPHEIALYGKSNCDIKKLIDDLQLIIREEITIFGSHPCENYVFVIHNTENIFGGLEHLHSSVNFVDRWSYNTSHYQKVISLLAHEYFHLWNVKRIRPESLGPFNYSQENFTTLLWFFEGITSYYDDYICYRSGVTSKADYISIIEKNLNEVLNTAGIDTQTLSESSFDAWLKYYRRNENSNNTQVSYYTKGAVIGLILDFLILDSTNGEQSLDDVMKALYQKFLSDPNKGVNEKDILAILNKVTNSDFSVELHTLIHTTGLEKIDSYFELAGIKLKDNTPKSSVFLGLNTQFQEGKLIITELNKNYGAYNGKLNVKDEIISIDGFRAGKDYLKLFEYKKPDEKIIILISREGIIKQVEVTLSRDNRKNYTLQITEPISKKQAAIQKRWLFE